MPIRLLFLNTRDQCGADVAVHLALMKHFDPREVEVHVISNLEAADAEQMRRHLAALPHVRATFLPLGKPAGAMRGGNAMAKAAAYVPSLVSLAKVAAYIRDRNIQVVHATDRPRDASFASLLGRLTRAITVIHMHAPVTADLSRLTLWGLRNASAVIAVSDAVRRDLAWAKVRPDRAHTVHNAVDGDLFDPERVSPASPSIRQQFGIPLDAPLAGIAARMNPWKGQLELIGAASILRELHPDLHVMILGANEPETRARLEQAAREGRVLERIHFAGFQQDVRPFLREFDLFVHPSYCEPFGLSIVEAMAMKKAVIACNSGGVPEIITHDQDGVLVEERSPAAVADAMARLLADPVLRRQMGERARDTISRRFTPRQQSAAVTRLYARLVSRTASARSAASGIPG